MVITNELFTTLSPYLVSTRSKHKVQVEIQNNNSYRAPGYNFEFVLLHFCFIVESFGVAYGPPSLTKFTWGLNNQHGKSTMRCDLWQVKPQFFYILLELEIVCKLQHDSSCYIATIQNIFNLSKNSNTKHLLVKQNTMFFNNLTWTKEDICKYSRLIMPKLQFRD